MRLVAGSGSELSRLATATPFRALSKAEAMIGDILVTATVAITADLG
jgi:hypothetical protein